MEGEDEDDENQKKRKTQCRTIESFLERVDCSRLSYLRITKQHDSTLSLGFV